MYVLKGQKYEHNQIIKQKKNPLSDSSQRTFRKRGVYYVCSRVYRVVSSLRRGLNSTSTITKLPPQCSRSKGMPEIHQLSATAGPPVNRYTGAHRAPKNRPNTAPSSAQARGCWTFRIIQAPIARISHTYR